MLTAEQSAALQAVADDLGQDVTFVKGALAAYKTGGKAALFTHLTTAGIPLAQKEYADVRAALPMIKEGYKTTEFWLVLGAMLLNGIYLAVTGKALPLDANVAITALVGVYTLVRGLIKKPASTSTSVASTTVSGPAAPSA